MSEAFRELEARCGERPPEVFLVLGSGMGGVADRLARAVSVPFAEVPGLPPASVAGHRGSLSLGTWAGRAVLVSEGRLHHYEGHPWEVVTLPIRLAARLGACRALLTCAAGGIGEGLDPGCVAVVTDHVEWLAPFPWRCPGSGGLGPPRGSPYSARLGAHLHEAGRALGAKLREGVYAAVTGPSYETPAEIRALRVWGADLVGMSTTREIEAGVAAGMECAALALVTNRAAGLEGKPLSHEEVMAMGARQGEHMARLLERVLAAGL